MKIKNEYDYTMLKTRITEAYGSMTKFASAMGCSKGAMSLKLNNKSEWQVDDMLKASELLGISQNEIPSFFMQIKFRKINNEC